MNESDQDADGIDRVECTECGSVEKYTLPNDGEIRDVCRECGADALNVLAPDEGDVRRYSVSLEDSLGTVWSTVVEATSPSSAFEKAEQNAAGSGQATAIYADSVDTGERYHAE